MNIWILTNDQSNQTCIELTHFPGLKIFDKQDALIADLIGKTPSLLLLGPDLTNDNKRGELKSVLYSHVLNHWDKVALTRDLSGTAVEQLYQLGCTNAVLWQDDSSYLKQLFFGLLRHHQAQRYHFSGPTHDILSTANVIVWEFDVKIWRYVYVSESVVNVLGYPAEKWYEQNFTQVLIHPEDRARINEFFRLVINQPSGSHELRGRMLGSGGRVVWLRFIISVCHEVPGDVPKVSGIALDITGEMDYLKEKLDFSERKLSQLEEHLNRAPIAVLQANDELKVTSWSPGAEQMFGISKEAAVGNPWNRLGLIHPDDEARVIEELVPLLNGQVKYQEVWNRNIRADGSVIQVHWVNTCLRDENGKLRSLLSMGRDVSAERAAQEQLREIAQMDATVKMASGLAHDFKNLLSPILVNAEKIAHDKNLPFDVRKTGERIVKNCFRSSNVLNTLLKVNRPLHPELNRIDSGEFINELMTVFEGYIPSNISLTIDSSTAPQSFVGDENLLHQAVVNLINNACQAIDEMPGNIDLKIFLADDGEYVVLQVTDSGPGIPEVIKESLLIPFFTTKKGRIGTGLGLFMVDKICEAHHGKLRIFSEEGKGTKCSLTLPRVQPSENIKPETKPTSMPESVLESIKPLHILVVDDDSMMLNLVKEMLVEVGHGVVAFGDAKSALQELSTQQGTYDLVITDNQMANTSGLELVSTMIERNILVPVLIMTGSSDHLEEQLPPNSRVVGVLEKPFSMEGLVQAINNFIESA